MKADALPRLDDPALYERVIARLGQRRERLYARAWMQEGLPLAQLVRRRRRLARLLARAVGQGRYRFSPSRSVTAVIDGKRRVLYRQQVTDTIVACAVATLATELADPYLSSRLYSFRKGWSAWRAIRDFGVYLTAHREAHADPRDRGLYVLRRDITAYGDSIPIGPQSALWRELDAALGAVPARVALLRELIGALWCPLIEHDSGVRYRLAVGVPTGSPIQPLACNLYLASLDRALDTCEGAFYARYGDDVLFAHPDATVAREAAATVDRVAAMLALEIKPDKRADLYFTGAGRGSAAWPEARGTNFLEYLGCRVGFDGQIRLKQKKAQALVQELKGRLAATSYVMQGADAQSCSSVLADVASQTLTEGGRLAHAAVQALSVVVNDRRQLKELDYLVALCVAEHVTSIRGPRAFRRCSYKSLKEKHGLLSLVVARNHRGRSKA